MTAALRRLVGSGVAVWALAAGGVRADVVTLMDEFDIEGGEVVGAHAIPAVVGVSATAAFLGTTPFSLDGGLWTQESPLVDPTEGDAGFGSAVDTDGEWAVVGAPLETNAGFPEAGAAYVYQRQDDAWVLQQRLAYDQQAAFTRFGSAVSIDGDRLAVGAPGNLTYNYQYHSGAVCIYVREGTSWSLETAFTGSQISASVRGLGRAVAVSGTVLVAAHDGNQYSQGGGSLSVFRKGGGPWTRMATLRPTSQSGDPSGRFATAVAVEGSMIAAGWPGYAAGGRVYLYELRDTGVVQGYWYTSPYNWQPYWSSSYLQKGGDPNSFGAHVALLNGAVVIGYVQYSGHLHQDSHWWSPDGYGWNWCHEFEGSPYWVADSRSFMVEVHDLDQVGYPNQGTIVTYDLGSDLWWGGGWGGDYTEASELLYPDCSVAARDGILLASCPAVAQILEAEPPPVADPQAVNLDEDTPAEITLTGTDPDEGTLAFAVATQPQHGTLTGTAPSLTYTPAANYNGQDAFSFVVVAGGDTSSPATVTLVVAPVNDSPYASNSTVTTSEDTPVTLTLSGGDPDGDPVTYAITQGPAHGTVDDTGLPTVVFTPTANWNGSDSLTFRVTDAGQATYTATVTLNVTPVNDLPEGKDLVLRTARDTACAVVPQQNDPVIDDPVEGSDVILVVVDPPAHGELQEDGGDWSYTPNPAYLGPDHFTYRVSDGTDYSAETYTVQILVTTADMTYLYEFNDQEWNSQANVLTRFGNAGFGDLTPYLLDSSDGSPDTDGVTFSYNGTGGTSLVFDESADTDLFILGPTLHYGSKFVLEARLRIGAAGAVDLLVDEAAGVSKLHWYVGANGLMRLDIGETFSAVSEGLALAPNTWTRLQVAVDLDHTGSVARSAIVTMYVNDIPVAIDDPTTSVPVPLDGSLPVIVQPRQTSCVPPAAAGGVMLLVRTISSTFVYTPTAGSAVPCAELIANTYKPQTRNVLVTSAAAFQFVSPACEATTETLPVPVNTRFVKPVMVPGSPTCTAKETPSPLEAVADRPTSSVRTNAPPLAGRKPPTAWSAMTAATVPVTEAESYKSSCARVARISMVPLPAATARLVPSTIRPGPPSTAKLTAPVPDPPETARAFVVP